MTAPQKSGQCILFALLWPFAVEKNPTPPLLHYFKQHSGQNENKSEVIDSESLLAIGQDAIGTWKRIP